MRVIRILLLLAVLSIIWGTPASAAKNQQVTVTWTPEWSAGLTSFTMTVVNDNQIDFNWTYDGDHDAIMIRGKYGSYPDDIPNPSTEPSDGFLIYNGDGTSASWYFDENISDLCIKAWAQNVDNSWNTEGFTGLKEAAVILIALMILPLVLTVAGYALKRASIAMAGGAAWAILGAYSLSRSEMTWDIFYTLFFLAMMLGLLCVLEPVILRERKGKVVEDSLVGSYGAFLDDEQDAEDKALLEDTEKLNEVQERLRSMTRSHRRTRASRGIL